MSAMYQTLLAAVGPLVLLFVFIEWRIRRKESKNRKLRAQAEKLGLDQPVSLHPYVDPQKCIGSGACVAACPEKNVLGVIDGRATLINASSCIGHGACAASCPMDAITLVFGTTKRGVDIPRVSPQFETTVPGVFLAGEIGGMGLIRNAVEQGRQAAEAAIASLCGTKQPDVLDLLIVGGGPAGISAARVAQAKGVDYLVCEQEDPGGAVLHYPRGKVVLTRPIVFPDLDPVKGPRLTKEQLMDILETAAAPVNVRRRAKVVGIDRGDGHLTVELADGETLRARRALIAVGRRGSPRKLGVEGEDQGKVVYRLLEPKVHAGQDVLVVGGGNSAVESALMLADEAGTTVRLSYRGEAFARVAPETRERLDAAVAAGRVELLLETEVQRIDLETVTLSSPDGPIERPNDAVIVQIGGTVPTAFLRRIGVLVDVHKGRVVERDDA
ncbi:MAG: NAD(P)-binding domain-containing protein [Myxococcales bacterium]|nr:NAD(P)-binding domain-containing protein [Myxococcales bacterium]